MSAGGALTLEQFLLLLPYNIKPEEIKGLDLSGKAITALPKQTAFLTALRKFVLATNNITRLEPVALIKSLTHLDVSHNPSLADLRPLQALTHLVVLNVSACAVRSLSGVEGSRASLKALLAGENDIRLHDAANPAVAKENSDALRAIAASVETVVLSKNSHLTGGYRAEADDLRDGEGHIAEDPQHPLHTFALCQALKKLSLSHCDVCSLPRRWYLPRLTELRLAHNTIDNVSGGVVLQSLKVLDVANNRLPHWRMLHRCKYLKQLTLRGNPLLEVAAEGDAMEDPLQVLYVRSAFLGLELLDGRKLENPPAPAAAADIQAAIRTLRRTQQGSAAPAVRVGNGVDDDEAANDASIMMRKRRRDAEGTEGDKAEQAEQPTPQERPEYQIPAGIEAKGAGSGGSTLVRRERRVEQPAKTSGAVARGADALAMLRGAGASGW